MCNSLHQKGKLKLGSFDAKRQGIYLTMPAGPTPGKVIDLLSDLLNGMIPVGYRPKDLKSDELELPSPLSGALLASLEGASGLIKMYVIQNRGIDSQMIQTDVLKKDGVAWVFLNAYELDGNERALCILGVNK